MLKPVSMQLRKSDGSLVGGPSVLPLHYCDQPLRVLILQNPNIKAVTLHIEDEVGERDVTWTPLRDEWRCAAGLRILRETVDTDACCECGDVNHTCQDCPTFS